MPDTTALALKPSHTAAEQVGTEPVTGTALATVETSRAPVDQEQGEEEDLLEGAPLTVDYYIGWRWLMAADEPGQNDHHVRQKQNQL